MKKLLLIGSAALLCTAIAAWRIGAQQAKPSPAAQAKCDLGGGKSVTVDYSSPRMKGRKIFGGLVPYGEVWRTGANASTRISFSTPVKFGGAEVPAGDYSLFTIPNENEWTVILNKDIKSSPFSYNASNDVVRVHAPVVKLAEHVETFTILVNNVRDDSATIDLLWDHTCVPVKLELDLAGQLVPKIEAAMAAPGDKKPYYQAAMFYYNQGLDLHKAKDWIDAAVKANATYYVVYLQAQILAKLGDKEGAIAAAKHSSELAAKAPGASGYLKLNEDLISSLH